MKKNLDLVDSTISPLTSLFCLFSPQFLVPAGAHTLQGPIPNPSGYILLTLIQLYLS